jgi:hypothetical protein
MAGFEDTDGRRSIGMSPDDPLHCPEDYLWIHYRDGSGGTVLEATQLRALYDGTMPPNSEAEHAIVANQKWLRIMLKTIGTYPVAITEGEPLPQWADHWVTYCNSD